MSEPVLPADALEILVGKVVTKFTQAEISMDEAASRLVGTGRFEENGEALEFLRNEVCPRLEERLQGIEDDIAKLNAEAERIRGVLGFHAPTASLLQVGAQVPVSQGRPKKEKTLEKKRKGATSDSLESDVAGGGLLGSVEGSVENVKETGKAAGVSLSEEGDSQGALGSSVESRPDAGGDAHSHAQPLASAESDGWSG